MTDNYLAPDMSKRFRGFLPVVLDVETGGLNWETDALLEIAAILLKFDDNGQLVPDETLHCHVKPFEGARIDPEALKINGIDPNHPFRDALPEHEAIHTIYKPIRNRLKETKCNRAILVGHNAPFDLNFMQAACKRANYKRDPFHPFTTIDTAGLAAVAYGHSVLAVACKRAGIPFDVSAAHSAIYDAEKTTALFCKITNYFSDK